MKLPMRQSKFGFVEIALLLVLSPLIIVVIVIAMLIAIPQEYLVTIPIIRAIELKPRYWMSAFETKRASGKSTKQVLDTLRWATNHELLECRFRDHQTVRRLERILKRKAPSRVYPAFEHEVIFYEFRVKVLSGKRSKKRVYWQALVPRYATA